jgi:hypothetical protein
MKESALIHVCLPLFLVVLENPCSWLFLRTPRACAAYEGTWSNDVRKSLKKHGRHVIAVWSRLLIWPSKCAQKQRAVSNVVQRHEQAGTTILFLVHGQKINSKVEWNVDNFIIFIIATIISLDYIA